MGAYEFAEVLAIFGHWCSVYSLTDELTAADLNATDLDNYESCQELGSTSEIENCNCWMDHYINAHFFETCLCNPSCPDDAPFGPHAP